MRKRITGWYEHYKCGCTSDVVARKRDLVGYCGRHGENRSTIHKVDDPDRSFLEFAEKLARQRDAK